MLFKGNIKRWGGGEKVGPNQNVFILNCMSKYTDVLQVEYA